MAKEPLSNSPGTPIPNNELTKDNIILLLLDIRERLSPEYAKSILSYYSKGSVAPKVIAYILDHGGFTIPTLSYQFKVPRETIYAIFRRLSPGIIQTREKLEHPIKSPGNKANVWRRFDVDLLEAVNEARTLYYETLKKYDPAVKIAEAKRMDMEKQKDDLGRSFMEEHVKDHPETRLKDILTYLRIKGIDGTARIDLANMIAELVKESGVKVWR